MSFGGGSGGSGSIQGSSDVFLSSPTNGQVLSYNSGTLKWVNSASTGVATWDDITNKPPQVRYVYYTTTWPTRPTADTVIWVGGNETTPPSSPSVGKDIWIRDSDVV